MGLWIGISVVSIAEVVQLFMDLIRVFFEKEEDEKEEESCPDNGLDDSDMVLQELTEDEFNDLPPTPSTDLSIHVVRVIIYFFCMVYDVMY